MNQIKTILKNQGRSQRWLAVKLNKSYSTITKYCNNVSQPKEKMMVRIASLLELDVEELFSSGSDTEN
ncbi:MAG TPA: helix-turn-helix transcriptional regulator [Bacteroidia bacterium]|jgi:putative transcriptional regulator|nr:helix-turn-helix transcriptional regulator [Bacteroidia bacterium]